MIKAISNNIETGSDRLQPNPPTVSVYDLLNEGTIEWESTPGTRAVVILVPAYPESMRTAFARQKKRIARLADEDLRNDIQATIAAVAMMQKELDRRTLAAKQKRLDDAKRDMERDNLRIERNLGARI
jgi:hypothetical protein